jgi:hypothetical protein
MWSVVQSELSKDARYSGLEALKWNNLFSARLFNIRFSVTVRMTRGGEGLRMLFSNSLKTVGSLGLYHELQFGWNIILNEIFTTGRIFRRIRLKACRMYSMDSMYCSTCCSLKKMCKTKSHTPTLRLSTPGDVKMTQGCLSGLSLPGHRETMFSRC